MVWVTTDDTAAETWRRVMEFTNIDLTLDALTRLHGQPETKRLQSNYAKQARQIRVCIHQAREYFSAAEASSIITSPNHLYYGMVSLAAAIMLLRGDGEKSLDRLRQAPKNRNHGLNFSTNITASNCAADLRILEESRVEVRRDGFFLNWYSTLQDIAPNYAVHRYSNPPLTTRDMVGSEKLLTPSAIAGQSRTALELVTHLPDLSSDLNRYGVRVVASRASFEVEKPERKPGLPATFSWRIHGAPSPEALQEILAAFTAPPRFAACYECTADETSRACRVTFSAVEKDTQFTWPSMREDLNNEQFVYAASLKTHEIVDAYLITYALSMLSRYFPDIWIACIESHCRAASLIQRLVSALMRKFPLMALAALANTDMIVSSHKPPWYQ